MGLYDFREYVITDTSTQSDCNMTVGVESITMILASQGGGSNVWLIYSQFWLLISNIKSIKFPPLTPNKLKQPQSILILVCSINFLIWFL